MPTSRISKVFQGITVAGLTSVAGFFVWTKHAKIEQVPLGTDSIWKSPFYKKFNPSENPTLHDVCVRRLPLFKLRPELVEDASKGGTKLVEAFCAGVWGGFGYTIQRKYLERKYRDGSRTAHQLWDQKELLDSTYEKGTEITDHFQVLEKTPTSILIRCGDSPLNSPDAARPSDGLFEITAETDMEKGFAEFKLKSIFYKGTPKVESTTPPMVGYKEWLHQQYAKLWMESAIRNVK